MTYMVEFKYIFEAMEETEAVHILMHLPKVSARRLILQFGSASRALEEIAWEAPASWEKDKELLEREGVSLLSYADEDFPSSLRDLPDFPLLLYVKGRLLPQDSGGLAIVGTRNCSIYGLEMAELLAEHAAAYGVSIISGLARGIDTSAHKGALKKGRTVAFIGSGLCNLYPRENLLLAQEIAKQGAVISEYPMLASPERHHFPRRNRLISGLSGGVLLVEAPLKSGAMITMEMAEAQGKHCFALPGRIDSETFKGNHFLLKGQKAQLVEKAEEMVSILLPGAQSPAHYEDRAIDLTPEERQLVLKFPGEEIGIEALAERAQLSAAKLNVLLMGLVLKKVIKEFPGKYYKKVG